MTPLLPDPVQLREQLEHARATRNHLDEVIDWLEAGIALLSPAPPPNGHTPIRLRSAYVTDAEVAEPREAVALPPPVHESPAQPEPEPPPAPPEVDEVVEPSAPAPIPRALPASAPARPTMRDHEAKITSALISSNQPLSKAQLADRSGLSVGQLTRPLMAMVERGAVIALGRTVDRRYTAPKAAPQSDHAVKAAAGRERNEEAMTAAVDRIKLRDAVWAAIVARPRVLDDHVLAQDLEATEADVRAAAEWFMARDRLVRMVTGCYAPTLAGRDHATRSDPVDDVEQEGEE